MTKKKPIELWVVTDKIKDDKITRFKWFLKRSGRVVDLGFARTFRAADRAAARKAELEK